MPMGNSLRLLAHFRNSAVLCSQGEAASLGVGKLLALAVNFNASFSSRPAWAVICQNVGAPPANPTAGATDGNLQTNTACGLNANAAGNSGNTAIGVNANASGNFFSPSRQR